MIRDTYLRWTLPAVSVTGAEAKLLLGGATSSEFAVFGDSTSTSAARAARALATRGAVDYGSGRAMGWPAGLWAAYLTVTGFNALWRHHGDTHVDGCGSVWGLNGDCSGCSSRRRLDAAAIDTRLAALDDEDLAAETGRADLWCPEHGYLRAAEVTTAKVCLLAGSPIHDGGLVRL